MVFLKIQEKIFFSLSQSTSVIWLTMASRKWVRPPHCISTSITPLGTRPIINSQSSSEYIHTYIHKYILYIYITKRISQPPIGVLTNSRMYDFQERNRLQPTYRDSKETSEIKLNVASLTKFSEKQRKQTIRKEITHR